MNRLNDLCLNDMVPENVQMFGYRDWQTTASRQVLMLMLTLLIS